jgi:SAM-dependent methyltransferase
VIGHERQPKLYGELASWFHLLTAPADYAEEAAVYLDLMKRTADVPLGEVLELGSGGGNNASHMKARVSLTLVDISPAMLAVSRSMNPECEHIEGDMREVRLGRRFDGVFVHDAVDYLTTEGDLRAAAQTAFEHCREGGVVLFAPDHVRDTFAGGPEDGGHDGPDGRSLRYLSWTWDPDPLDTTYVMESAYLLREPDGTVTVEGDRHVCGLFPGETWLRALRAVGFEASVEVVELSDTPPMEVFLGRRPVGG